VPAFLDRDEPGAWYRSRDVFGRRPGRRHSTGSAAVDPWHCRVFCRTFPAEARHRWPIPARGSSGAGERRGLGGGVRTPAPELRPRSARAVPLYQAKVLPDLVQILHLGRDRHVFRTNLLRRFTSPPADRSKSGVTHPGTDPCPARDTGDRSRDVGIGNQGIRARMLSTSGL
jgi:hypothetical protein